MKKVSLLSREELKKVHGGGPPPSSFYVQCRNEDNQDLGPIIPVETCNTEFTNIDSVCGDAGFHAASMFFSKCYGI